MQVGAFTTGAPVLLREVFRGRVWAARPATMVQYTPELVPAYVAPGTRWKRPVHAHRTERLRMPLTSWTLEDATWTRARTLHLMGASRTPSICGGWRPTGASAGGT